MPAFSTTESRRPSSDTTSSLCGAKGAREIAEWARDLDDEQRAYLHCRRRPTTGELVVPSESTIQRTLRHVDRDAFDAVNETMRDQVAKRVKALEQHRARDALRTGYDVVSLATTTSPPTPCSAGSSPREA